MTAGRFHAKPTDTELSAALGSTTRNPTQRLRVYDAILAEGDGGLTYPELAEVEGVNDTAHRTRCKELQDGGWVVDSGSRRTTPSGAEAIVWMVPKDRRDVVVTEVSLRPPARETSEELVLTSDEVFDLLAASEGVDAQLVVRGKGIAVKWQLSDEIAERVRHLLV